MVWEASIALVDSEDLCLTMTTSFLIWDVEEEASQAFQALRLAEEVAEFQVHRSQSAQQRKQCTYALIQQWKDSNDQKDNNRSR